MNDSEKKLELKNPPAVEVVFDISIKPNPGANVDSLAVKDDEFLKKFPINKPIHKFEGKVEFSAEKESSLSHTKTMLGFSYKSEEQEVIIQRRINGFSYHKLGKYCGWQEFVEPAIQNWLNYSSLQSNLEIQRLGLRFVNFIEVNGDPAKALKIALSNTKGLGSVTSFNYQYSLQIEGGYFATVILGPIDKDGKRYVLDIDVFKQDIHGNVSTDDIKQHFENMRKAKNLIFSNTLKPKILNLYK